MTTTLSPAHHPPTLPGLPIHSTPCNRCAGTGRNLHYKRLGRHMRGLRVRAGRSQREVARRMRASQSFVSLLEAGTRDWTGRQIEAYLAACNGGGR